MLLKKNVFAVQVKTDLLLNEYPQQNSLLFVKIYQLMSSLLQSLWHASYTCCWRWWELLQELYSTKRSSPWDDAGFLGKFIFWWIWFRWLRLEVGGGLTLFLAKSAEANPHAPRDATAIHYMAVGRNTQPSNWEAEILALIYGRLTSLFGEGKKVSLCTLCSPTGVSRVTCGKHIRLLSAVGFADIFAVNAALVVGQLQLCTQSFPLHPPADSKHRAAHATSRVFQVLCKCLCWVCNLHT